MEPNDDAPLESSHDIPVSQPPRTNGKAIASLVLGIMGFMCWIITALPAIIFGILALRQNVRSKGALKGDGLAIAGITTGALSLLCCGLFMPALLLPAVQAGREAARANASLNNMKEITLGMFNYESDHRRLPVAGADAQGNRPNLSWRVQILPYIGYEALYQQFHHDEPWDSPHNLALLPQMPPIYQCPNLDADGKTVYLAVTGPGAAFQGENPGPGLQSFSDGLSHTIYLVEANADQAVEWTRPDDWEFDPNDPWRGLGGLRHRVVQVAFLDGRAERIAIETPDEVLRALFTRAGFENPDDFAP